MSLYFLEKNLKCQWKDDLLVRSGKFEEGNYRLNILIKKIMEFNSHLINDKFYPLKVWLSSLIVGSTIFVLFDSFGNLEFNIRDLFFSIATLIIYNLILGLPGLLVFIILFWNINNSKMKILWKILDWIEIMLLLKNVGKVGAPTSSFYNKLFTI